MFNWMDKVYEITGSDERLAQWTFHEKETFPYARLGWSLCRYKMAVRRDQRK